jgi:hypothetical protein
VTAERTSWSLNTLQEQTIMEARVSFPADWRGDEYDMVSGFAKEKRSLQLF